MVTETYGLGVAVKDAGHQADRSHHVQVLSSRGVGSFCTGYYAYVFESTDLPEEARRYTMSHGIPCVANVALVDDISSGDIIEINNPVGCVRILHFVDSEDNSILLTNRCNCNCLMCPDSEHTRRQGRDVPLEWIATYLSLVPPNTRHLCITGGEPTLLKENLFAVLDMCRQTLPDTRFLLLTNGRMFCYADYARKVAVHGPRRMVVATALHSAMAKEHDRITGVDGSFQQTLQGIRNLLSYSVKVEVRIVIQKANCRGLGALAALISSEVPGILQVSFMGLELRGNAAKNLDEVWVNYQEVTEELGQATRHLVRQGITPRIYNLPLCVVDPRYWSLCVKSISDYKRTYKDACARCTVLDHCGGLFGTMLNHRLTQVTPVEGSTAAP